MSSAYLDGLKMLGRRELSEKQIRQRLARKEHSPEEIEEAVARLREERAINDQRVAEAIARMETGIRKRGKVRVRMQLERAGIAKETAKAAIEEIFGTIDDEALLESSLRKRLRGREALAADSTVPRPFPHLVAQRVGSAPGSKAAKAVRADG